MKIGLIHTIKATFQIMTEVCKEIIPVVKLNHFLDEEILKNEPYGINAERRLLGHIRMMEDEGASAVLVVCNVLSPLVDKIKEKTGLPLVKIDEVMVERAVEGGGRIAVIGNNEVSPRVCKGQIDKHAKSIGVPVRTEIVVEKRSLEARNCDDLEEHNRLIRECIEKAAVRFDKVVLSQASLSTALDGTNTDNFGVPVLSSPRSAVEKCRKILNAGR
jgi:Asp/Glu/hydantoin racemase